MYTSSYSSSIVTLSLSHLTKRRVLRSLRQLSFLFYVTLYKLTCDCVCGALSDGSSSEGRDVDVVDSRQRLRRLRRSTEFAVHGRDSRIVRDPRRHEPVRAQPHHLLDAEPLHRRPLALYRPLLLGPQHLLPAMDVAFPAHEWPSAAGTPHGALLPVGAVHSAEPGHALLRADGHLEGAQLEGRRRRGQHPGSVADGRSCVAAGST